MANEVVKHHNDLNTIPMRNWTSEEMNFFFSILAKLKDKGTTVVEFNSEELKELARYSDWHLPRFQKIMENLGDHIASIRYYERTSHSFKIMNLFSVFEVKWNDDMSDLRARVGVTENYSYIVNKLNAEFTSYELQEFTSIRSTYAKTMYRLLKQWRTIGKVEYKREELKTLLDTPSYYGPSEIDKNILKPVLRELSVYFNNLKVKKIKSNKRGTPVIAYEFTFTPEKTGTFVDYSKKKQPRELTPKWLKNEGQQNRSTDEMSEEELEIEREKLRKELAELDDMKQTKIDDYIK